jgi:hypothetical protein
MDEVALPDRLREEVLKFYPNSRRALMKSGGNFPFLARSEEFNMYVEVRHFLPIAGSVVVYSLFCPGSFETHEV